MADTIKMILYIFYTRTHLMNTTNLLEQEPQRLEAEWRLRVFGAERLAYNQDIVPSAEAVEELTNAIADCATDAGSMVWEGVYSRRMGTDAENGPQLLWDPAHIMYGFLSHDAEHTVASVTGLSYEECWLLNPAGSLRPGKYAVSEDLEITDSGEAKISRQIAAINPFRSTRIHASKPANATEVAAALDLVNGLKGESAGSLPVYVEIGYGVDPSALLGSRTFINKAHFAFDPARGDYTTSHTSYPEAVRAESVAFAQRVNAERPGQHIVFAFGEGNRLPLGARTVREVFAANIVNTSAISNTIKRATLADIYRVLEPNGRLVLKVNWHQDEWPVDVMTQFLADNGFSVRKVIAPDHKGYRLLESEYGTQQKVAAPEGYYLIAQRSRAALGLGRLSFAG
jgi:hypothetical protein